MACPELDLLIQRARLAWIAAHRVAGKPDRGWFIANDDNPLQCGIEKDDEAAIFESDYAALLHATQLALDGDLHARNAIILHLLCNELRGLTWGDAYINTRLGPP